MSRARSLIAALALTFACGLPVHAQGGADDDAGYRAATGLLHRDLPEQAATEYQAFLKEHPNHPHAASARYGLAVCLTRLNKWKDAAAQLELVSETGEFEFAPDALLLRAQCAIAANEPGGAERPLTTLLKQFPKYEHADTAGEILGETLYRSGRFDDAAGALERVVTGWPQSPVRPRAEFILALTDTSRGRDARAAERLEGLRTSWPQDPLAARASLTEAQCRHRLALADPARPDTNQVALASRLYADAARSDQEDVAQEALLGRAQLARASGKPAEAGMLLDNLLARVKAGPVAAAAMLERTRAYLDENKPERALAVVGPTAERSPSDAEAAYWAAKCEIRLDRFEAAARRLSIAAEHSPENPMLPEVLYDRALALGRGGHVPEARAGFAEMRAKFPRHSLAPEALASEASLALAAGDEEAASQLCGEFLRSYASHPRAAAVQLTLADAELAAGHAEVAQATYAKFLAAHPNDPGARSASLRRGLALAKLGKREEAAPVLTEAVNVPGPADPGLERAAAVVLADFAMSRNDWAGAEKWLRSVQHTKEGQAPDTSLKLAICVQRQGRTDESLALFAPLVQASEPGPVAVQAAFEMGQILAEMGKLDQARESFERVLIAEQSTQEQRFTVHALRHLAAIASKQGHAEEAAELLGRIAKFANNGAGAGDALYEQAGALMSAGKYELADAALTSFLQVSPDHPRAADARAQRAIAASRQARYDECLELSTAADSGPTLSPEIQAALHYERAWALKELHRPEEAAQAYTRLLSEPVSPSLRDHAALDLAQLRTAGGDYSAALKLLKSIPNQTDSEVAISERAQYLKGLCELKMDQSAQAAATLDEFMRTYPRSDLRIPAGLLAGQAELRSNRPDAAAKMLSRVVEAQPPAETLGPALLCLGEALGAAQRWDESRAAFERYGKEFPQSDLWFQACFGIGWALENQGRHAEAIGAYRDVVARHKGPTAARAQFQIGECLFAQKQHEQAVSELLKVDILYSYPEWSAAALYEAGRCLTQLHKSAEARQQYAQVIDRFKDTEWARLAGRELKNNPVDLPPGAAAPAAH